MPAFPQTASAHRVILQLLGCRRARVRVVATSGHSRCDLGVNGVLRGPRTIWKWEENGSMLCGGKVLQHFVNPFVLFIHFFTLFDFSLVNQCRDLTSVTEFYQLPTGGSVCTVCCIFHIIVRVHFVFTVRRVLDWSLDHQLWDLLPVWHVRQSDSPQFHVQTLTYSKWQLSPPFLWIWTALWYFKSATTWIVFAVSWCWFQAHHS